MLEFIRDSIGFYTLTAIIGLLLSAACLIRLGRARQAGWRQLLSMLLFAVAGVLIGSHLLFFIINLPEWIQTYRGHIYSTSDFISAFGQGASGLVFYGGLLGALIGIVIFCRITKLYLHFELDHAVVVFPLFHFFGRIGCALNGCCYGIEYHGIFAIQYSEANIVQGISDDIADFPRFPVQLLEAVIELGIFFFLLFLYKKTRDKYSVTSIYLFIYSIVRFFDEFLRGDSARKIWGPFSTSQWISIFVFAGVIIYLAIRQKKHPGKNFFAFE